MASTKRRTSQARTGKIRANWKLTAPNLVSCPQCHTLKAQHAVCKECGYYKGKEIVKVAEA